MWRVYTPNQAIIEQELTSPSAVVSEWTQQWPKETSLGRFTKASASDGRAYNKEAVERWLPLPHRKFAASGCYILAIQTFVGLEATSQRSGCDTVLGNTALYALKKNKMRFEAQPGRGRIPPCKWIYNIYRLQYNLFRRIMLPVGPPLLFGLLLNTNVIRTMLELS